MVLGTEHMAGLKMEYCTATVDPSMSSLFVLERLWKICMEGQKQGLKVGGSEYSHIYIGVGELSKNLRKIVCEISFDQYKF